MRMSALIFLAVAQLPAVAAVAGLRRTMDAPPSTVDYRECGTVMNTAWSHHQKQPCSADAMDSIVGMRKSVAKCAKLRWGHNDGGATFGESLQALQHEHDTWCGPQCHPKCGAHGACQSTGEDCKCEMGYKGPACEEFFCNPGCSNGGNCTSAQMCTCPEGWTGNFCETPVCSKGCENGGKCMAPDTCVCTGSFFGDACERRTSVGLKFGDECLKCVGQEGYWCLKDGKCANSVPGKTECPESDTFSLVVHGHPDPCHADYNECASLAARLSVETNDGLCSEEGNVAYKAAETESVKCNQFFIMGVDRPIGYLAVEQKYSAILDHAKEVRDGCKDKKESKKESKKEKKEKKEKK